jgi:hypothetical protein
MVLLMAHRTKPTTASFLKALQGSGLPPAQLRQLVKASYSLHAKVGGPVRIFPIGIPVVDGVGLEFVMPHQGLVRLVNQIKLEARVRNLEVFPLGIPWPEQFMARAHIR